MNRSILVTGASGFLGSHICRYFGELGYKIAAVGRFSSSMQTVNSYPNLWKFCEMTLPDSRFINLVREFQPSFLIHCAGTSSVVESVAQPYNDFQRTVEVCGFTLETIRREAPGCMFILLSSAAVYGNPEKLPIKETTLSKPVSPYGFHKRICEDLVEEYSVLHGITCAVLRIFSAYGEGLRRQVIYDLAKKFTDPHQEQVEVYGTGQESRDFIHSVDIARSIEFVAKSRLGGTFNVASGNQIRIYELLEYIRDYFKSIKPLNYTGQVREGEPINWEADISKLTGLGFGLKVPFQKGLESYLNWFHLNKGKL